MDWPWIFRKGGKPSLVISTLEALAVLLALEVFHGDRSCPHRTNIKVIPTCTDNRGNGSALNCLMTTRFPASAVVMDLAAFMKKESIKIQVEWLPRSGNAEADALVNGELQGFDPALRQVVDPKKLVWEIHPKALELGASAELESPDVKENGTLPNRGMKQRKRKPEERMRATDPW